MDVEENGVEIGPAKKEDNCTSTEENKFNKKKGFLFTLLSLLLMTWILSSLITVRAISTGGTWFVTNWMATWVIWTLL